MAEETQTPKVDETQTPKADEPSTPLRDLWAVVAAHQHPEIWGVTLEDPASHVPTQVILQKYLNANDGDVAKAKEQLTKTLDWRAQTKPLDLLHKSFNKAKFGGLGFVTQYGEGESKEIFTWNIYGAVQDINVTFGDLNEFIHWRVALMELALQDLSLSTATQPVTAEHDPYKIYQVHDYKSISFLRQSPQVKAASQETIKVFATAYPELLKEKFFVNVPAVMGFMYGVMKLFVAAKTAKKFHPMSNGGALSSEFAGSKVADLGEQLPPEYGGKGGGLDTVGKETLLEE